MLNGNEYEAEMNRREAATAHLSMRHEYALWALKWGLLTEDEYDVAFDAIFGSSVVWSAPLYGMNG